MESSGAWGNRARASYGANPFVDDVNDNPFSASSQPPEQVVETVSNQHAATGSPFGTWNSLSRSPQGQQMQDVPLQQPTVAGHSNRSTSKDDSKRLPDFQPQTPPRKSAFDISAPHPNPNPPKSKHSLSQPSLKGLGQASSLSSNPSTGPIGVSREDIERRTEELRRWEADLAGREALLRRQAAPYKNWPRCFPIVHHDIAADIPFERKGLVRSGYVAWCVVAAGYLWNFISLTAFFIAGQKKVSLWVMAGLVAVAGLPLSFLCWYRGLYFAASRDSAGRWLYYMLNMLVHIVWCWWMFVGINPDIGGYSAGLFTMISQFNDGGGKNGFSVVYSVMQSHTHCNGSNVNLLYGFVLQGEESLLALCA